MYISNPAVISLAKISISSTHYAFRPDIQSQTRDEMTVAPSQAKMEISEGGVHI